VVAVAEQPDLFDFFTPPGEQPEETVTGSLARVRHFGDLAREGRLDALAAIGRIEAEVEAYLVRQAAVRDAEVTGNGEGMVRADPAITSARAARNVEPNTGNQRGRILTALVEHGGLTDLELAVKLGMLDNSVRPRRTELVAGGYAEDSGRVREHRGSEWIVWTATEAGRAWWSRNVGSAA
jgi:hypothetical protein